MIASLLQFAPGDVFPGFGIFILFIFVIIIITIVAAARAVSSRGIQRPVSQVTNFPPPPPPDTEMVKCQYCGTEQTWSETCVKCGAPMPKPAMP